MEKSLEQLISESGLKIKVIARRMGTTAQNLWIIRQNPRKMDSYQIESLAAALGVEVDTIFNAIKNFALEFDKLAKK